MRKYWAMKTFKEWWTVFENDNIIGIDQDGVDQDYTTVTDPQIQTLLTTNADYTEYKDRVFREFCKWMQIGDFVVIGTGPTTEFNISGIALVSGGYTFDHNRDPRHIRSVDMLRRFATPRPMQRFSRTSRLELIDDSDFHEAIISLI